MSFKYGIKEQKDYIRKYMIRGWPMMAHTANMLAQKQFNEKAVNSETGELITLDEIKKITFDQAADKLAERVIRWDEVSYFEFRLMMTVLYRSDKPGRVLKNVDVFDIEKWRFRYTSHLERGSRELSVGLTKALAA
jgi:hypothetical protein